MCYNGGVMDLAVVVFAAMQAATPLLIAGLGALVAERAGVLNLGVEGMMLIGAVVGFIAAFHSDSALLGTVAAAGAGGGAAALFALLTVGLRTNQVATGLALTIFGTGFSAFVGLAYEGKTLVALPAVPVPGLEAIPFVGEVFFRHDAFTYFALALAPAVAWFLFGTRAGLALRAVGENHEAAAALGYRVSMIRFAAVVFGGAMAGVGGAFLSIAYTPLWAQNMTAGRGWVVLALVVFAAWRPWRLVGGAFLFGFVGIGQLFLQGENIRIPTQFLTMTPYLATIAALVIISLSGRQSAAPQCLTRPLPMKL